MAIAVLNRDTKKVFFLRNKVLKKLSLHISRGLTKYDDQGSGNEFMKIPRVISS
jgi:hypothetical protein